MIYFHVPPTCEFVNKHLFGCCVKSEHHYRTLLFMLLTLYHARDLQSRKITIVSRPVGIRVVEKVRAFPIFRGIFVVIYSCASPFWIKLEKNICSFPIYASCPPCLGTNLKIHTYGLGLSLAGCICLVCPFSFIWILIAYYLFVFCRKMS